jgi:hypothetical protein
MTPLGRRKRGENRIPLLSVLRDWHLHLLEVLVAETPADSARGYGA